MPIRNCKRRGHGWLAGNADIGWSNSIGWYEGFSLLTSVDPTGAMTDKGFEGAENHLKWLHHYGARVIHPPKRNSKKPWSKRLRRWVASIRQVVESTYDKLFNTFGLWRERPHELEGLRARLAARMALHDFCIWLNDQLGRPRLAFADLLAW